MDAREQSAAHFKTADRHITFGNAEWLQRASDTFPRLEGTVLIFTVQVARAAYCGGMQISAWQYCFIDCRLQLARNDSDGSNGASVSAERRTQPCLVDDS